MKLANLDPKEPILIGSLRILLFKYISIFFQCFNMIQMTESKRVGKYLVF